MFSRKLAAGIAKTDGISPDGLEDAIRKTMADYFRDFEHHEWKTEAAQSAAAPPKKSFVKHKLRPALKHLAPESLRRTLRTVEETRKSQKLRAERRAAVETLRADGADQLYLDSLNAELDEIEKTLTGDGFVEFLRATAPECLAEAPQPVSPGGSS